MNVLSLALHYSLSDALFTVETPADKLSCIGVPRYSHVAPASEALRKVPQLNRWQDSRGMYTEIERFFFFGKPIWLNRWQDSRGMYTL